MNPKEDFTARNGQSASDEVRVARSPGFGAASNRDEDRRASEQRKLKLLQRVAYYDVVCTDLRTRLNAAVARRDGLPEHARGWPLMMYVLLAALTIGLEWVPASMFTQIFYQTGWVQYALTLTFTAVGVVVAIFFGELLRRLRVPEHSQAVDKVFLFVVGFVAVIYLGIGYFLRVSYTNAVAANATHSSGGRPPGAAFGLSPSTEAIALTAIAAIGMILTVVSTYHRESLESYGVHSRIRQIKGDLLTAEGYKNTNEADLDRVEKSERPSVESAPGPSPATNGEARAPAPGVTP